MKNLLGLKVFIIIYLIFNITSPGNSKLKWEKIDKSELEKNAYPEAPEAPAVILLNKGSMIFRWYGDEFKVVLEKYQRVKILNEKGYDYATVRLVFNKDDDIDNFAFPDTASVCRRG